MDIDFNKISYFSNPPASFLRTSYIEFLTSLAGPTVIDISGKDPSKCRVITTLLHGNEPSGLIAVHRWLTSGTKLPCPQTNIRIIICSVEAATEQPLLSHRYLEGGKDLNRCFGRNRSEGYYARAKLIEQAIREVSPELVIDLHNTSGSGPAFAVCPTITPHVLALTSYFCNTMILSGIHLGALMEQDFGCSTVTIECGGSNDHLAHEAAFAGINHIFCSLNLSMFHYGVSVEVIYQPLRLRLRPDTELSYRHSDQKLAGVTLKSTIERSNFERAKQGEVLGWLDDAGLDNFELLNEDNENVVANFFTVRDNQLICATNLRIFMATNIKKIAITDCLFYLIKDNS